MRTFIIVEPGYRSWELKRTRRQPRNPRLWVKLSRLRGAVEQHCADVELKRQIARLMLRGEV